MRLAASSPKRARSFSVHLDLKVEVSPSSIDQSTESQPCPFDERRELYFQLTSVGDSDGENLLGFELLSRHRDCGAKVVSYGFPTREIDAIFLLHREGDRGPGSFLQRGTSIS